MKEEVALEIKSILKEKFNYDLDDVDDLKDCIENVNLKVEMMNYLFSFDKEDYYNAMWNIMVDLYIDDINSLNGIILEVFNDVMQAKEDFFSINYNVSMDMEGDNCKLVPMNDEYKDVLLNALPEEDNELHSTIFNYDCNYLMMFAILNEEGNVVGELNLVKLNQLSFIENTYNLAYYILPSYRRKGYAYNACKVLLNNALNNKLLELVENSDKHYTFYPENKIIDQIIIITNNYNNASINLAKKLNAEYTGYLKCNKNEKVLLFSVI